MAEENKPVHIVKPISVYIDDAKVGDIKSGTYKLASNRDALYTDGGYTGHTAGSLAVSMSIETIVGVTTQSFGQLHKQVINQGYVRVALPVEGVVVMFVGVIKDIGLKWDHTKGSCDGDSSFEGGRTQQQGG